MIKNFKIFEKNEDEDLKKIDPYGEEIWNDNTFELTTAEDLKVENFESVTVYYISAECRGEDFQFKLTCDDLGFWNLELRFLEDISNEAYRWYEENEEEIKEYLKEKILS
jgi:hypothetical protein